MNSAEVLPPEDHAEFARVLDEALRTARLTTGADRHHVEHLRALALKAAPQIAGAAEAEYQRFARLREELRGPERSVRDRRSGPSSASASAPPAPGSGVVAMVVALVPVLATIAAVIFLALGYALGMASPEPAMAKPMREVGLVFAVLAAVGLVVAVAGLLVAAARNGSETSIRAARPSAGRGPLADEVALARTEWRRALLDHGIMPFLREQAGRSGPERDRRTPRPRFTSPDFSSPHFGSPAATQGRTGTPTRPRYERPRFSGPEFTSPDFSSPDEVGQEAEHGRGFAPPDYSGPEFSSPEFSSPDFGDPDFGDPAAGRNGPGSRRGFAAPDYSSPDFSSPADGGADRD